MVDLAVISGSGFYDFPGLEKVQEKTVKTKYGASEIRMGQFAGRGIAFIARHGKGHRILPNLINHKANLTALKELEAKALVAATVCGVLHASIPLAKLAVFDDLYFPDNRLPNGEICSVYDQAGQRGRGHFIFDKPFSQALRAQIIASAEDPLTEPVYAHVNGPRFNSAAEIEMLKKYADFISQTAGPEVVLAGELEIPCALIGFGVDYATGVTETPTPVEVLNENLRQSREDFLTVLQKLLRNFEPPSFEGIIYRFD